jgi:protein-S-isoprenylcysteine O-methyltransferase Ste14
MDFLAVFFLSTLEVTLYLMKNDPELLELRTNAGPGAEKEKNQKIIQSLASLAFITVVVFPGIDHRFAWSVVPACMVIVGDILVALGLLLVF